MSSLNGLETRKRKQQNKEDFLIESNTKKIKVQAQRKFAQNAVIPISSQQKPVQSPLVSNNVVKPPTKRPNTEDFLTFLCFRGTSLLPPRLDFFNKPQRSLTAQEIASGKKRKKSISTQPTKNLVDNQVSNGSNEKKKVKQIIPQTKYPLSKLGQKVIGRNLVRSGSRFAIRQEAITLRQLALRHGTKIRKIKPQIQKTQSSHKVKYDIKNKEKQQSLDGKQNKFKGRITRSNSLPNVFGPGINQLRDDKGKWCKGKTSSTTSKDSDIEERSSRKKSSSKTVECRSNSLIDIKQNDSKANSNHRKTRSLVLKHHENCNKNLEIFDKNTKTASSKFKSRNITETKIILDKHKVSNDNRSFDIMVRSRPPRRTKEAATIFMDMLKKDIQCSNEKEGDSSSIESFPELPNIKIKEAKETKLSAIVKTKHPSVTQVRSKQSSCKRNLRPRRSSTVLDDYIMTDSEDDETSGHKVDINSKKSRSTPTTKAAEPKKVSVINSNEIAEKNIKLNKTEIKTKKSLNKVNSESSLDHKDLVSDCAILKCGKDLDIKKNNEKRKEKPIKHKTDKFNSRVTDRNNSIELANNLSSKDLHKKEDQKGKKTNLDLYNNNKKKSIPSSAMFTNNASQTKDELLEQMAANFVNKHLENDDIESKKLANINVLRKQSPPNIEEANKKSKIGNIDVQSLKGEICIDNKTDQIEIINKIQKRENLVVNELDKVECILNESVKNVLGPEINDNVKINIPEYFSSKSFQLPKFKQSDGLSVLSEICSALPRFNEPCVSNKQLLTKLSMSSESINTKYSDDKKDEKTFESRTMKIVNLARNTNEKKDLASWRQAFKNVKVPKNGLSPNGNTWINKKLIDNQSKKTEISCSTNDIDHKQILENKIHDTLNSSLAEEKNIETKHSLINHNEPKIDPDKKGNSNYLTKTTILPCTKYDLKFEKRLSKQQKSMEVNILSQDDLTPEKKIFQQRRLSTAQSCSGNSSDAFSPENETSVYAFQPDLPVSSTPFRRNKTQSPIKSRTVSPNTSISVNFETDLMEGKSQSSTNSIDIENEEGRLFYIPLPAGVQTQPSIQGVTVKLGTEGPQNKLVMSAKLVTKPPNSTISISSISSKSEQKIKPLCVSKISNKTTPVGTVQPTTRLVQPTKNIPTTSKEIFPFNKSNCSDESKIYTQRNTELKRIPTADKKKSKKIEKRVIKKKVSEKISNKTTIFEECAVMVDAPTFYPTEDEFKDPLEYFEVIKLVAQKYGICRVVPPASFKPECKVSDDMRFTAYNQYVHKMMDRWGPNVREMTAIKKYLETQSIILSNPPLIGGMELDLPRLYHTVQELGGLKEVIELDKWSRVADLMKIPKSAQDRVTKLDDIYCKYLLPYDTLNPDERQKLMNDVDKEWKQICRKGDTENEIYEDINDCITKGRSIALSAYYRVARNTSAMWFKETQTNSKLPDHSIKAEDVESFYWKQVEEKKNHICVLSGSIDSGTEGYGFPTTKTATFTKHPWNLKVLTNNSASVLKSLGPVMGMTVPTIHMGMIFSACCWYKDPHGLPWIEYSHTGADKIWYSVSCNENSKFRQAMKTLLPRAVAEGKNNHSWLAADSGMVPPTKLLEHGVTLTRTIQNPGQFLIVMPNAYTCNISTGYVISESVYFTQSGWLNNADKIFQDLQRNCEPAAFSFEKLLINMSTDSRTPHNILMQLLNTLSNMRDCEIALRSQLEDLGLKTSERIQLSITSKLTEQNDEYECDVCHSILYVSMVHNSHEDCDYCLRHGIEILAKKHNQLKFFKFMYTLDENELDSIIVKLKEKMESKKKKLKKNI
ncbi:uncharacterized protein LOC126903304 [Daktulosphaira vitifoliae]|uniref:uncharacterized protein LOC126903304 n=1 Tax=Daktulosphaira vitifoliae TaxID=58002 RepID=UPI0021AA30A5|nr:uncharacterized protein LOC126903304 [Daktulosphaira vitifoliae]